MKSGTAAATQGISAFGRRLGADIDGLSGELKALLRDMEDVFLKIRENPEQYVGVFPGPFGRKRLGVFADCGLEAESEKEFVFSLIDCSRASDLASFRQWVQSHFAEEFAGDWVFQRVNQRLSRTSTGWVLKDGGVFPDSIPIPPQDGRRADNRLSSLIMEKVVPQSVDRLEPVVSPSQTVGREVFPMTRTPFDDFVECQPISTFRISSHSPDDIASLRHVLLKERAQRIRTLVAGSGSTLVPRCSAMASDGTAQVRSLLYIRSNRNNSVTNQLDEMNAWASSLDLRLDVVSSAESRTGKFDATELWTQAAEDIDLPEWVEDYLVWRGDGSFSVLPPTPEPAEEYLRRTLISQMGEDAAYAKLALQGAQGRADEASDFVMQLALSFKERGVFIQNCYVESGNKLLGKKADGTDYVVIGEDSLRVSQLSLEAEFPELLIDHDIVRKLMADDFGVAAENVLVIPQPSSFHIDMGVALLPGQKAIVNDTNAFLQATEEQVGKLMLKPIFPGAFREKLEAVTEGENACARQLTEHGFEVFRGPFACHSFFGSEDSLKEPGIPNAMQFNFLNRESGISPSGHSFMICTGNNPLVAQKLSVLLDQTGAGVSVFFTSNGDAQRALKNGGGVGCRMNALPLSLHETTHKTG